MDNYPLSWIKEYISYLTRKNMDISLQEKKGKKKEVKGIQEQYKKESFEGEWIEVEESCKKRQ